MNQPEISRLACALVGVTRVESVLQQSIKALCSGPNRNWALFYRQKENRYQVVNTPQMTQQLAQIKSAALGRDAKVVDCKVSEVLNIPLQPAYWNAVGDPASPSLVIATSQMAGDGLLVEAAELIVSALQAARRHESLLAAASSDPLTGLQNRKGLIDSLEREMAVAQRHAQPLSVLFLDLDRFKAMNDTFGHKVGDIILIQVAKTVQKLMRTSDIVGRLGGDEFVVVLPMTDRLGSLNVAKRIQHAISRIDLGFIDNPELKIGVTIGAATMKSGHSPADLLELADLRMLRNKKHHQRNNQAICKLTRLSVSLARGVEEHESPETETETKAPKWRRSNENSPAFVA